jgi:hypothetical protein
MHIDFNLVSLTSFTFIKIVFNHSLQHKLFTFKYALQFESDVQRSSVTSYNDDSPKHAVNVTNWELYRNMGKYMKFGSVGFSVSLGQSAAQAQISYICWNIHIYRNTSNVMFVQYEYYTL